MKHNLLLQDKKQINSIYMFFTIGYVLFYIALFMNDIARSIIDFNKIGIFCRYSSYVFIIAGCFLSKKSKREIVSCIFLMLFGIIFILKTHVFYFTFLALIIFVSTRINKEYILKVSFYVLLISTLIVIVLCNFNVIEEVTTHRWTFDLNERRSLGFYHSNVLPLIYMYLVSYFILLMKNKIKCRQLIFIALINLLLYIFCKSRNSFIITLLLVSCFTIIKIFGINVLIYKILYHSSRYIVLFWSVFSLLGTYLTPNFLLLQKMDLLLSMRFYNSLKKIKSVGLKFISTMNTKTYFSDGIVVDNGYMYVAIRYGIIMILLLIILGYCISTYVKGDVYSTLIILAIVTANFVDNDIFDYSCLPFIVLAVKKIIILHKKHYLRAAKL